ncbi:MAG: D-arabinono-1,4-lactone oxidase [Bacteroidota bacterium]
MSTKYLNKISSVDKANGTITIESGVKYGDFAEELHQQGYALHNLASLPHITVAGACATATHGSGINNGNLATAVVAIELVTPEGETKQIDRTHPDFNAIVVGLGAFGLITKLTLEVQDTFDVRQDVFLDLPLSSLESNFEEIVSSGYSVSLFTDWLDEKISEVWIKRRLDQPIEDLGTAFFGAKAATRSVHPIVAMSAESCTEQMGEAGAWYERLPHFKMGFVPSVGNELQSEYFIPRTNAVEAILALENLKDQIAPVLLISEIRFVAADSFWMSPCYNQECIALHFTWKQLTEEVLDVLPKIESALRPFNVKPHWGKLFTIDPKELQSRYQKYPDFIALAGKYDPKGKFKNAFLTRNLY